MNSHGQTAMAGIVIPIFMSVVPIAFLAIAYLIQLSEFKIEIAEIVSEIKQTTANKVHMP